jgi:hypothetical protein
MCEIFADFLTSGEWHVYKVCPDFGSGSRASGPQTPLPRCPTECHLVSSEEPWRAQVSIRLTVDKYGNPLDKTTIRLFGDAITSKFDVEERIKRAQLAILNPSTLADNFLTVHLPFTQTNESRFSKNSIILDISGPGVDDLVFVDLPGACRAILISLATDYLHLSGIIVSGSADGNDGDIKDVENLVGSHIEKPNCLILLAVTCESEQIHVLLGGY